MPIREDVLVVGGGLGGGAAALAAAETGATVRLITYKNSTLRHASGLVDVLGYAGDDSPVVFPYSAIRDLSDDHPYSVVGESAVRDGMKLFDEIVGDAYLGSHTPKNALVPTHGGTVKPTARYPRSAAAGLASDDRSMLVVGFRAVSDFDARLAADHLRSAGVPFDVYGATVEFPRAFRDDARLTRYAAALDADEDVDGTPTREALAEAVKPHLDRNDGVERVGFPALLGDDRAGEVRADLGRLLGADVFEIPMGPPSLPGLRLEELVYEALEDAGVRVEMGNPVVGYESKRTNGAERLTAVTVDRLGARVPYHADQFVLATGGLVGKGIDTDRDGVSEPVFGCHVPHPEDRYEWFVDEAFGDHPFAKFGVVPDAELRPLGADGDPEFVNLRAAGAVLGGADYAAEKSGSGVSLATGRRAGRGAGEAI